MTYGKDKGQTEVPCALIKNYRREMILHAAIIDNRSSGSSEGSKDMCHFPGAEKHRKDLNKVRRYKQRPRHGSIIVCLAGGHG